MGNKQSSGNIDYKNMNDEEIAEIRREQRKEKRHARPRQMTPKNSNAKKKPKRVQRQPSRSNNKDREEDVLLSQARLRAPAESPTNIVFLWNHQKRTFNFYAKVKALKSPPFPGLPRPSNIPKKKYINLINYLDLDKLDKSLRTSEYYIPSKPSFDCYIKLPWTLFFFYCVFFFMWLFVFESIVKDEDEDSHIAELLVIGLCLLLMAIMIGCIRKLKWVSILDKRQKSFQKKMAFFNINNESRPSIVGGDNGRGSFWIAKVGQYGSFICFELESNGGEPFKDRETKDNKMRDRYGFYIKDSLWVGKNASDVQSNEGFGSKIKSLFLNTNAREIDVYTLDSEDQKR